jgi:hypothetical protein
MRTREEEAAHPSELAEACRLLRALTRAFQPQSGAERDLQRTVEVFLTVHDT